MVEQLGSGIPRILDHYGKESFNFSDNFLRMTFAVKETTADLVGREIDKEEGGQIGAVIDDIEELTHRQKEILKIISSNIRISRSGIAEIIHVNESAIQKHLNSLKEKGYLERINGTRGIGKFICDK